jgi:hypothetical protein
MLTLIERLRWGLRKPFTIGASLYWQVRYVLGLLSVTKLESCDRAAF